MSKFQNNSTSCYQRSPFSRSVSVIPYLIANHVLSYRLSTEFNLPLVSSNYNLIEINDYTSNDLVLCSTLAMAMSETCRDDEDCDHEVCVGDDWTVGCHDRTCTCEHEENTGKLSHTN